MLLGYALIMAAIALGFTELIETLHRRTDVPVRQAHWVSALFGLIAIELFVAWEVTP